LNSTPAIRTEALTKIYRPGLFEKPTTAVSNLDIEIPEGEVFGFIGLNGAGKTTTIKLLLDHARPTNGRALLFGEDARNPRTRARVGYLPDLPHFHQFLSAGELLDYAGKLFGLSYNVRRERSEKLLKSVGLEGHERERLRNFSRGMLQRLGLAQALINEPALVILDEPLGGLDPIGRADLREIISGLKSEGRTVFFSSHILDDAQRIADRIGIIHQGRMIACGKMDELLTKRQDWEVELEAVDGFDILKICREMEWQANLKENLFTVSVPDEEALRQVYTFASEGKIRLLSVEQRRLSLEEAFLKEVDQWRA